MIARTPKRGGNQGIAWSARHRGVHFEALEDRHLLSVATASPSEPPVEPDPPFPVIDLNGPAPGTDYATTVVRMSDAIPIVDPDALVIHSAAPELQFVELGPVQPIPGTWSVDTTGTNITAHVFVGSLVLDGVDTVAHYQQVLRTLQLVTVPPLPGHSLEIDLYAIDANQNQGPQVHSLVTIENPPPALVDLNGSAPGDGFSATFTIGGPPVPIVDPAGLTIQRRELSLSWPRYIPSIIASLCTSTPRGPRSREWNPAVSCC